MTNPTVSVGENFRESQEEINYGATLDQKLMHHIQNTPVVSYMEDSSKKKLNLVTHHQIKQYNTTVSAGNSMTP